MRLDSQRMDAGGHQQAQGIIHEAMSRHAAAAGETRTRDAHAEVLAFARAGMAGRVKVRTANMKMFDAEVRTLVGIFNDAWSDNWGYVPFTQAERK